MKIAQVYGSNNQTLKNKVINFWIEQKCLSEEEAKIRIEEALCALLDDDNNVIAISSGKVMWIDRLRDNFLYYRSYTKPEYRNQDLGKLLFKLSREYLNTNKIRGGVEVKGIYIIYESEILNKNADDFVRYNGLTLIGWTDKNQQIRVLYLDGAKINI
jgi:GNAT superfamily N-acetyltransferase